MVRNRVLQTIDPLNNTSTSNYGIATRTTTATDPSGVRTTNTADLLGRKLTSTLGTLQPTRYEYDVMGNVLKITDPANVLTEQAYNAFGEVTSETRPVGPGGTNRTAAFAFDDAGRQTSATDFRGLTTTYGYDEADRLTSVTLPAPIGAQTSYLYDDLGERVRVTDGSARVRDFVFDARGLLASLTDARGSTGYTYDGDGRIIRVDDPRGITQNFTYDNLGRRTSRFGIDGQGGTVDSVTYGYDANGNTTSVAGGGSTTVMGYDDANRLTSVAENGATTSYVYSGSQLASRTDPAGTTTFAYRTGGDGLLASLTDPLGGGTPTTYGYDTAGRQTSRTDPAGLTTTRAFDPAGRIASQVVQRPGTPPTTVASFALTYDENSNVLTKSQQVQGYDPADAGQWTYTYDQADRLKTATDPAAVTTTYAYDGAGNRTSEQVGAGAAVTTTFDGAGHPLSSSDGTAYGTDAAGNLTSVGGPARTWTYSYDTWSRLSRAEGAGASPSVTYAYDGLDRTVSRLKDAVTTRYDYVGTSEDPASIDVGGAATTFAWSPGGPLAQRTGTSTRYLVKDLHDDVVGLADPTTGSLAGSRAFGPWGTVRRTTGDASRLGYQSDLTDPDTGLVDMMTRLYDPAIGRFQTRDALIGEPNRPATLNQFVYGEDGPVSSTDPTGMCADPTSGCPGTDQQTGGNAGADSGESDDNNWAGGGGTDYVYGDPPTAADVYLRGDGTILSAPVPVFQLDGKTVVTPVRSLVPVLRNLFAAIPKSQVEVVLRGMSLVSGSDRIIVGGFQTRGLRIQISGATSESCRGLAECFFAGFRSGGGEWSAAAWEGVKDVSSWLGRHVFRPIGHGLMVAGREIGEAVCGKGALAQGIRAFSWASRDLRPPSVAGKTSIGALLLARQFIKMMAKSTGTYTAGMRFLAKLPLRITLVTTAIDGTCQLTN